MVDKRWEIEFAEKPLLDELLEAALDWQAQSTRESWSTPQSKRLWDVIEKYKKARAS